jgi:two-component system cell cycle response regulator
MWCNMRPTTMSTHLSAERDETQPMPRSLVPAHARDAGPRTEGVITVLRGPNAGALFTLDATRVLIGRSSEAQVLLRDGGLSRQHALIVRDAHGYRISDLGSTNGTYLNGSRLTGEQALQDGARIELGEETLLRFGLHDAVEQAAARRTHELTVRDPLTRLLNKAHVAERLAAEVAFARRHHASLGVLLIDVDEFKRINDVHGHEAGDVVLRVIAHALERTVRTEDVLGRYGGEEFAVLARGIGADGAIRLADRLCEAVRVLRVPVGNARVQVTITVGLAHTEGDQAVEPQTLLEAADKALYQGKHAGRDRFVFANVSGRERRDSGTRSRTD